MPEATLTHDGVRLSPTAAKRVAEIQKLEGNHNLMLRLEVLGGGCSGFQYKFELEETTKIGDRIFEMNGKKLIVDEVSLSLLDGAIVDFKTDLGGSFFQVDNPNASANCGCGASFSV